GSGESGQRKKQFRWYWREDVFNKYCQAQSNRTERFHDGHDNVAEPTIRDGFRWRGDAGSAEYYRRDHRFILSISAWIHAETVNAVSIEILCIRKQEHQNSVFEMDKHSAEVLTVFFNPVIPGFNVLAIEKPQDSFFQRAAALARNDLNGLSLGGFRFVDDVM